ncbi:MAG: sugar transferase, partial [Thermodesulfovibrionales bacterium]
LVILSPVFAATALLIKRDSEGPVFFRQERLGKDFRPFMICKFRTMTNGAETRGARITVGGDTRITRMGQLLRRYKIDELPQLLNVLKGEMSLVGPRPEVREFVELFKQEYGKLLRVRPGITDPASLRYSEEEKVLSSTDNWQADYTNRILPEKIRLSLRYVEKHDIFTDVGLIFRTIFKIAETR